MYMVCFTRKTDDTKVWVPYFDIQFIVEKESNTAVRIRDRAYNSTHDVEIQEEAKQILDQMKQISKGE